MNKPAHTPLPWRYSREHMEITTSRVGIVEGSKRVADVNNSLKPNDEVHANAALIVHSVNTLPELLAAAEALLQHWDSDSGNMWNFDRWEQLRAAIEKARQQ